MREVWMCRWEIIPGDGVHPEKFPTLEAAKKVIGRHLELLVAFKNNMLKSNGVYVIHK